MMEEKLAKEKITEIENLYEERKDDYQKTKTIKNRLEATNDINISNIKKMYSELDESVIKAYGLELNKEIEKLTLEEIENLSEKFNSVFNDISSKLINYLRTGQVEVLGELMVKDEPKEEKVVSFEPKNEQPNITHSSSSTTYDDISLLTD